MEFRKSTFSDINAMMQIINDAKLLLKKQNINQWQCGYPNQALLEQDIKDGIGYVLYDKDKLLGLCAITFGADASYSFIDGQWKTSGEKYAVVHRMAVAFDSHGKGIGLKLYQYAENIAKSENMLSIRADTHHQNVAMQRTMQKAGFSPCGTIYIKGGEEDGHPRIAMEKII